MATRLVGPYRVLLPVFSLACVLGIAATPLAQAQEKPPLTPLPGSHSAPTHRAGQPSGDGASTLSGVLEDSLGNVIAGAQVDIFPPGTNCSEGVTASTTTASDGSFSVSVSPGSYDVDVGYQGDTTDPGFSICTENVDLTSSADDTLTVPVTQLTVTAEDSSGDLLQGATFPADNSVAGNPATFDLFPGNPLFDGFVFQDTTITTGADGTAVIPLMPMTASLTLPADPPSGSNLAPTTISTGTMTSNTALTVTLYSISGTVASAISGDLAGQTVTLFSVASANVSIRPRKDASTASGVSTVTNSSGFYGLTVAAGKYKLQLSGGKANSGSLPNRYKVKTAAISLTKGKTLNIRLPVVDLTVTVKNYAGRSLKGVKVSTPCTLTMVTLAAKLTASGSSCGLATTNSKGVAHLGLLATASISITATPKAPYQPTTITDVSADHSASLTIAVSPGKGPRNFQIGGTSDRSSRRRARPGNIRFRTRANTCAWSGLIRISTAETSEPDSCGQATEIAGVWLYLLRSQCSEVS